MKILVTGANGFIGRHLISTLAARGEPVVAASRSLPISAANIAWRLISESSDRIDWKVLLSGCDAVVHLAGVTHCRVKDQYAIYMGNLQRVNVEETARLYAIASASGIQRFVFVSSLAAVTSRSIGLVSDETTPSPTTPYGRSKLAAEKALAGLEKRGGIPLTVLRPPVIYGEGNPGNMQRISRLIRSGLPLPFENLVNRRSFLYVGNLCDAIYKCLLAPLPVSGTYFISDNFDLSTPQLIRLIAASVGRRAPMWSFPRGVWKAVLRLQPDGSVAKLVGSLYLDVNPLMSAIAWSPPYTPVQGLRETLT